MRGHNRRTRNSVGALPSEYLGLIVNGALLGGDREKSDHAADPLRRGVSSKDICDGARGHLGEQVVDVPGEFVEVDLGFASDRPQLLEAREGCRLRDDLFGGGEFGGVVKVDRPDARQRNGREIQREKRRMPRTRVCGGLHPRVLSLPQKSPQDPVALVVLRLHVAAERPGEQCDDIVDLRASSLERCEEGAQCPALIRGEITSESAVEDAADVGLERGTECRVEHEL